MNVVVMTKGEWQAFGLVMELLRQRGPDDRILVWDDFSPPDWVSQMEQIATVTQHGLADNFSEHRNRSRDHFPQAEWMLMLDADEYVQPGFLNGINALVERHPECDAMFFARRNTFWEDIGTPIPPIPDDAKPIDPDYQGRAFKNMPHIFYGGIVHEGLFGAKAPLYLDRAPFTLMHHKTKARVPRYLHLTR